MTDQSVVVVGGGQAGFQTAASLRQGGFRGRITLIGDEPGLPYQRPPLSKAYLLGKVAADGLCFRPTTYFADQRIDLLHDRVTNIDRANRRIALAAGAALDYGHLVLAPGARNRPLPVPGAELAGVFGLRTLADADALRPRLRAARSVVVVGAGFIGLEFAAVAAANGVSVHVIELADRPMARAVSRETARFFREAHEGWGVKFDFGQGIACIVGRDGRVTAVELSSGKQLLADLVVFGIGVLPNVELAAEAGLEVDNGIRVDAFLRTSDPCISAIGDAASFPGAHSSRHVRLESVQNAVDQARCVAARLTGQASPYRALPWFWSDQGDLKLQIAGLLNGCDSAVVLGSPSERAFSTLCFHQGHLVAVESVNRPGDHMAARKILARPSALNAAIAAEPGFDLRAWESSTRR